MCAKSNFYMFVHSDLDVIFAPLVTLVQRYVSAVSTAFIFRKSEAQDGRKHRRMGWKCGPLSHNTVYAI